MYFKKINSVTSIVYMYVFDLLTTLTKLPKKKIFGTILTERNTTAMKKKNQQPSTKDFKIMQRTSNLTMHEVRQPTADFFFRYRKRYSVCTKRSAPISTTPVRTAVSTVC